MCVSPDLQKSTTMKGHQGAAPPHYQPEPAAPPAGKKGTSALTALMVLEHTHK